MRLKTLRLKNFKKHADTFIEFEDGSNMIVGPNYAGKTTILEGILVGLFGNSAAPGTMDELIRTGATDFSVEIVTTSGLTVTRSSKNSSVARGDNEPFARGHTSVNKAIADELGLDRKSFMKIFASEQGTPQQLLAMEGSELQRFLESCIGIEDLDGIVREANRRRAEHVGVMNYLADFILSEDDLKSLNDSIGSAESHAGAAREEIRELSKDLEGAHALSASQHEALSKALESNDRVRKYQVALAAFNEMQLRALYELEPNQAELARLTELRQQMRDVLRLITEIESLQDQIAEAEKAANIVVPALADTTQLEAEIENYPPAALINTTAMQVSVGELKVQLEQHTKRIKEIKKSLDSTVCPTCRRPLDDVEACQAELEQEMGELLADCDSIEERLAGLDDDIKQAEKTNQRLQQERDQALAGIRAQLKEAVDHNKRVQLLETGSAMAKEKVSSLRARQEIAATALSQLPQLRDVAQLDVEIAEEQGKIDFMIKANADAAANNREYERRRATLEAMDIPDVELIDTQALMDDIQASKNLVGELSAKITASKDELRDVESTLQTLNSRLEAHNGSVAKFDAAKRLSETYKSVGQILAKSRGQIVSDALDAIFAVASEFASACTNGDIGEVLVSNNAISYKEGGIVRSKACASGAQKTLMGIGMKLGLVKLTRTSFDCLLLDEISADMDAEVSLRCALALDAFCGQSVAVSHRPMDVAGNVIRVG